MSLNDLIKLRPLGILLSQLSIIRENPFTSVNSSGSASDSTLPVTETRKWAQTVDFGIYPRRFLVCLKKKKNIL